MNLPKFILGKSGKPLELEMIIFHTKISWIQVAKGIKKCNYEIIYQTNYDILKIWLGVMNFKIAPVP